MNEILNKTKFCNNCGELIDYNIILDDLYIVCKRCKNKINMTNLKTTNKQYSLDNCNNEDSNIITLKYHNSRDWKNKLYNRIDKLRVKQKEEKLILKQDCIKQDCDGKEIATFTLQLRSADEGSTVFYECLKCGYGYTQNN